MTLDEAVSTATNRVFSLIEFQDTLMVAINLSVGKPTETQIFRSTYVVFSEIIDPTLRFGIITHIIRSQNDPG